uniref:Uncharacterized protein n=1 Tax=Aegilops tauschii subsp. strangulata TaxID=200361 RepID=A0A453FVZ4_AEGTS
MPSIVFGGRTIFTWEGDNYTILIDEYTEFVARSKLPCISSLPLNQTENLSYPFHGLFGQGRSLQQKDWIRFTVF